MKRLVWYAGLYAGSAGLLKLAGFLLFLWFARTLSVNDYATFGLLYAVQTGVTTFSLAGIVEAVVGLLRTHRTPEERHALYAGANRVFAFMALVAGVIAALVFVVFTEHSQAAFVALAWVVASGALLGYASYQAQIVRLEERHVPSLLFSFVVPLVGLAGGGLAFVFDRRAESFFWGSTVGVVLALVALWRSHAGFGRPVARRIEFRALLVAGAPFVAVSLLGWLGGYGNNYVIRLIFAPVEVARFTFALSLAAIMLLVATGSNQVWSPHFYRITHEESFAEVEKQNRRFFGAQAIALGVVAAVVVAIFPAAIRALGGNLRAYQSMRLELALLLGSYVTQSPGWHCQNYFLAYGQGPELMRITIITSIIGIVVWIALMMAFGPIGVYLGFLTQMLLRAGGVVVGARRRWPVTISWEGVAVGLLITLGGFALTLRG